MNLLNNQYTSDGGYIIIGTKNVSYDGKVYLIKTDSLGNVTGISDNVFNQSAGVKIFPNPFTSFATLRVTGDKGQGTREFTMYDLLGREVTRSVILSGAKNLTIHRNNLPAGMYFYKVTGDKGRGTREIIATGKIIIQ